MSTVAYSSQLTKLEVLTASPSTWTTIKGCKGWSGPSGDLTLEDITNLDSPSGSEEVFPVKKVFGPITGTCIYDSADPGQAFIRNSNATWPPVLENFRLTTSATVPKIHTFVGYVTKFSPDHQAVATAKINVEIKPTGLVVIT